MLSQHHWASRCVARYHIYFVIWDCLRINLILIPQFIICYSRLAGLWRKLTQASNMLQHIIKQQMFLVKWHFYCWKILQWVEINWDSSGLRILPKTIINSNLRSCPLIRLETNTKLTECSGSWGPHLIGGAVLLGGVWVVSVARGAPLQSTLCQMSDHTLSSWLSRRKNDKLLGVKKI